MTSESSTITSDQSEELVGGTEAQAVLYMLSFLSVIGTAGNALVLYVFIRRKDRLVSTVYIISLAVVDFITCLVVIPFTVYMEHINFVIQSDIACKIYQFLITSNIPFSALIMVAIAVDRYLCICHPWRSAALMNVTRAKIVVCVLGVFAMSIGVIVGLMYGVYHYQPVSPSDVENSTLTGAETFVGSTPADASVSMATEGWNNWQRNGNTTYCVTDCIERVNGIGRQRHGHCETNELIIGENFQWFYQRAYVAMYVICLIVVAVLYVAIFWAVTARRNRKQRQRSKQQNAISLKSCNETTAAERSPRKDDPPPSPTTTCPGEQMSLTATGRTTEAEMNRDGKCQQICGAATSIPKGASLVAKTTNGSGTVVLTSRQQHESTFLANLRTAAMLFVVTVVFIVTFAPGFLMSLEWLPFNMTGFYLYFANNVANPVIYSFMNPNFRADLKRLVCRIK